MSSRARFISVYSPKAMPIDPPEKDGSDALYSTSIEIDEDAREEYWMKVRGMPENISQSTLPRKGKYSRG